MTITCDASAASPVLCLSCCRPAARRRRRRRRRPRRRRSPTCRDRCRSCPPRSARAWCRSSSPATRAPDEEDRAATGEPQLERSSGSGVIVDPDGYIVTNAHVVENATRIEVELPFDATGGAPGRSSILKRRGRTVGAQVVAIDHETDIAVVKVEARGLPALPFGDSDALRPGRAGAGVRQPARARVVCDDGCRERGRPAADAGRSDDLHPDRRADQSGQQRRRAGRYRGTAGRHQHADLHASRAAAKGSASPRPATSSATSSRRSASTAASVAAKSASARRRSRR